ncbi:sigma-70 family RNA polymerase sigma factor [Actinokineospora auranticolor]|uniref:RNA polymerase sigma-70 factor (ECF subfamily) n=1 Tax=Actinokineospora auranticolor TaxID=155976 RepID=A0A2S6GF16_9PSEU|nr:sigma-70 family RNA polymerase sigma factor [Actinokineospora auranticolor]PPK63827.1 RNA polymerase sigma-70 factor (ECF subfamily) [Actinokineospora auranticolor]
MSGCDEAELIRRAARGDRGAFERFYRATAPWLLVRLRRRCQDEQLVADVMQETYLTVWRSAARFHDVVEDGSGNALLWTIAIRRLVDGFRWQARQARPVPADAVAALSAEDELFDRILDGDVGAAMAALPTELRAVLHALVLEGLSVRETARVLDLPEGTVKTRARRARLAMGKALS